MAVDADRGLWTAVLFDSDSDARYARTPAACVGLCCPHVSKRPGAHAVLDPGAHGFVRNISASRPGFLFCAVSVRGFGMADGAA